MQNDIAVLRHNAFSLGGAVAALPPRTSMPSSGAAVRICGWGNTAVSKGGPTLESAIWLLIDIH